ncbi:MAG: ABC transporter ATP-binding protein, partial [Clostridia bacterium]|nr:ABC transporter ATP-binding protein [Clostridia bacterium]
MDCYSLENVSFTYPEQNKKALDGLRFSIRAGEFITLCGPSGCGKTTLLRQLKPMLSPHGAREGEILFEGRPLISLDQREQSERIGFVLQDPDNQIVTDKVWHELAFGLESLGLDTPSIRRRVAEMAHFFGIEDWFHQDVSSLSGGQKQLLNLASVMVMQPSVLLLDEPTSQLDPIAASEFLATVGRIHRELGVTVLITEHRLEEVFPLSDRVLVLDGGSLIADGAPRDVGEALRQSGHRMFRSMPTPMRVFVATETDLPCPVTVREGRDWLEAYAAHHPLSSVPPERVPAPKGSEPVVALDEVWFRYEKESPDVVRGLSLAVYPGEILAILGGNGAGKSTTLSLMAGLQIPYRGRITVLGGDPKEAQSRGLCLLPQNPQALFVKATVGEDLSALLRELPLEQEEADARLRQAVALCHLESLLTRHPFD